MKTVPEQADLLVYERRAWEQGRHLVAGMDEAGRGPWAGPVVAAAVFIDPGFLLREAHGFLGQVTDSKRLSALRRAELFDRLTRCPQVSFAFGSATAEEIDSMNILRATHQAMRRALAGLYPDPDLVLIDGLPVPGLPVSSQAIVRGDAASLLIAAASILAKETRDRHMRSLDKRYPGYGLARHKGYGTREHRAALLARGACPCHRQSFKPVRDVMTRRSGPGSEVSS